jgi:YD repeat-containing protein
MTFVLLALQVTPIMAKPIQDTVSIQKKSKITFMERLEELEEKRRLEELNLQMGLGLSDELRDGYSKLLLEYPDNKELVSWSNYRLAEYDYSRDQFEAAISRLTSIVSDYPDTPVSMEAELFIVDILLSPYNPNRDEDKATVLMASVAKKHRGNDRVDSFSLSRNAEKQVEKNDNASLKKVLSEKKQGSFKQRKISDSLIERVAKSKYNEDLAKIMKSEAKLLVNDGKYDEAYIKLDELLRTYTGDNPFDFFRFSTTIQDIEYQKTLILLAQGQNEKAKQELNIFVGKYPNSHLALRAIEKLQALDPSVEVEVPTPPKETSWTREGVINPGETCICGPIALRVALKEMGHNVSLTKLIEKAGTNYSGTTMAALAFAAQEEGVESIALKINPKDLAKVQMPSIILLPDHYVTVTEVNEDQVILYDSLTGWNRISLDKLSKQWDGYILVFSSSGHERKSLQGLNNAEVLTFEMQQALKGRYLCGNTGGNPGGSGSSSNSISNSGSSSTSNIINSSMSNNGSNNGDNRTSAQCGEIYAFDPTSPLDWQYASNDTSLDDYGIGGGENMSCRKAKPNFEQPENMADGYMDGIVSTVNRIYGNHNLMTPTLLLRGSQYTKINLFLTYNSQAHTRDSMVGHGWTFTYGDTLSINGANVEWVTSDGSRFTFTKNIDNSYTSPPGMLATLTKQEDGGYSLVFANHEQFLFDSEGKMISTLDERRRGVYLSYNKNKQLTQIKDSFGITVHVSYGVNNKISEFKVDDSHYITLAYDTNMHLTTINFPDQTKWSFGYNNRYGFLDSITDMRGYTTKFEYNNYGQILAKINAEGKRRTYGGTFVDYTGGVRSFAFDSNRRVTSVTDSLGKTVRYTYNADNNLTSVSDANGAMQTQYDSRGNITSVTDALGNKVKYVFDQMNHLLSQEDALGRKTRFTYDEQGNVLTIVDPKGRITGFTYDDKGNTLTFTNPAGRTINYNYDEAGKLLSIVGPSGITASYEYDSLGRRTSETDGMGNKVQFTYDFFGHVTQITYPDGLTETDELHGEHVVRHTDRKGSVTHYEYDAIGRIIKQTDPDGAVYVYEYDAQGRKTSTTDPKGNMTKYTYNARGQVTKSELPGALPHTFTYDEVGRLISETDSEGVITTYTYDALGRLISVESK